MTNLTDPFTKDELLQSLERINQQVAKYFESIAAQKFLARSTDMWSPAEDLVHLIKSASPVGKVMKTPKLLSKISAEAPRQTSRRYSEIRENYLRQLAQGAQAGGSFLPSPCCFCRRLRRRRRGPRNRCVSSARSRRAAASTSRRGRSHRSSPNPSASR